MNYEYCFPDEFDTIADPYTINCVDDFIFSHVYHVLNETVIEYDECNTVYTNQIMYDLICSVFGCLDSCVD